MRGINWSTDGPIDWYDLTDVGREGGQVFYSFCHVIFNFLLVWIKNEFLNFIFLWC